MDTDKKAVLKTIRTLFDSETLSVLSTQKDGQPYASIVAFAYTDDLSQILFLTPDTTRKYDNLNTDPRVALLINNSRNRAEDIFDAISVTAIGRALTLKGDEKNRKMELYLKRHPHMESFSCSPTTAMVAVAVDNYIMVSRFQHVEDIRMSS